MSYERPRDQRQELPLIPRPPEPDYRAIARLCTRHRDGRENCIEIFERLADYLGLDPRARMRVRHLLMLYNRPYLTIKEK